MQELELTWKRLASIWWLMMWRGTLLGVSIGAVAGFIAGLIGTAVGIWVLHIPYDTATYEKIGRLSGYIATVPLAIALGFFILRMAFRKKYKGFRIALVSVDTPAG